MQLHFQRVLSHNFAINQMEVNLVFEEVNLVFDLILRQNVTKIQIDYFNKNLLFALQ